MEYLPQIIFGLLLIITVLYFSKNIRRIIANIKLGKDVDLADRPLERLKKMTLVAFGQKKMFKRPIPAILHLFVYVGFLIINIEILEIIIDGLLGTHRIFYPYISGIYGFIIGFFECLAVTVLLACVIFLIRRNIIRLQRFWKQEMKGWPKRDANIILYFEIALMAAFLTMNTTDLVLQERGVEPYIQTGSFTITQYFTPIFKSMSTEGIMRTERAMWWIHIIGIFIFLNYIPFSKHLHIFLAFPNTYYSKLPPMGKMRNMDNITKEVKLMLDPASVGEEGSNPAEPDMSFGAKDVQDLTWKHLLDAYSCTECGRCTAACPANITGKKLSPRKIVMDTRDRTEEVGKGIAQSGKEFSDGKFLLGDYITKEELNACTSCGACVEECPVNIDPLSIIYELRRNLIMEAADAPTEWNMMLTNVENNGAPWQFSPVDRANWKKSV